MYCKNCGTEIYEHASSCPKCGCPTGINSNSEQQQANNSNKTNTLSIVGFVLSFFIAIAGLLCSIVARKQIRESGERGSGLALAGMIISIISLVGKFIGFIIYIVTLSTLLM